MVWSYSIMWEYWCGCAAKQSGLAGRTLVSLATLRGKNISWSPQDTTHAVEEISNEDITSVCQWERSGMERAAFPLRIGLSSGKWHAGEAEHV